MAGVAQLKAMVGLDSSAYKAGARGLSATNASMAKSIQNTARSLGAAFSLVMIKNATMNLVNFASEIRHTADNLNLGTESLQAINATALKYGATVQDTSKLLEKLRQSQGKVAQNDKTYIDALKDLNINTEEFKNADTDRALEMIARGYVNTGKSGRSFAAVVDLAGRTAKSTTALFEEMASKGLAGITKEAKDAGQVIEDELITKLELLGTRLEQRSLEIKVGFAQALDGMASKIRIIAGAWGTLAGGGSLKDMLSVGTKENQAMLNEQLKQGIAYIDQKAAAEEAASIKAKQDIEQEIELLKQKKMEAETRAGENISLWKPQLGGIEKAGAWMGGSADRIRNIQRVDKERQIAEKQFEATKEIVAKMDELKDRLLELQKGPIS